MAADIAREIIAQSKGGGKLAFSFYKFPTESDNVLLSTSNDANHGTTYHVHFIKDNPIEVKYSTVESAIDLISRSMTCTAQIALVLYKKNGKPVRLAKFDHYSTFSAFVNNNLHLLDVIDVVEG